ncbi:AAA-ATPase [Gordonia phage Octobien14]|uniref:AAA-ATPase n=1 Tax=Gordonia phage Octobien14 TaxID=2483673 RepID=A0A3G3MBB9_9CAUD|nr:AAA-ATPase [Gordonia phage Octobien14]AYR03254.1 AAA-ATPase [Gordonia phage Octobien14]
MGRHSKPVEVDDRGHPRLNRVNLEVLGDRQSGKTETILRALFYDLVVEDKQVLYLCRNQLQAQEVFHRFDSMLPRTKFIRRRSLGTLDMRAECGRGRICFRSINGSGHRGVSVDTVVLDDCGPIPDDDWCSLFMSTIQSDEPRMIVISTGGAPQ